MNGCIPFFPGLNECPANTMTLFPKTLIMENNSNLINNGLSSSYDNEVNSILEHTRNYLTTEYTAKKLIYGNI